MKLSVVLFVALVASVCASDEEEAHKKQVMEMQKKCLKESGTTPQELQACHTEKKECPKANCFDACTLREQGFINKDGIVNTKMVEHAVSELAAHGHPKTAAALKKCLQNPKKKTSFCDSAHRMYTCMEKEPHD